MRKFNMLNDISSKKLKILYSWDHLILLKFRQLVKTIVFEDLQMVFWTFAVSKSNENVEKLLSKI